MPDQEYTAKEALDLLVRNIEKGSPALAEQIRSAINAGKDIQVEEPIILAMGRKQKKKVKNRYYRKHIAYTDEEALSVTMTVLESRLIESRMLVNAAHEQFKQVGLASPKKLKPVGHPNGTAQTTREPDTEFTEDVAGVLNLPQFKDITIEGELETVQEKKKLSDIPFVSINEGQLKSLLEVFAVLKTLTDFKEAAKHGNA
jgi:hypothetical protein